MKLKKGDNVRMIAGNDRGKTGRVTLALPRLGHIVVDGIDMRKKHVRPRRQDQKGEIVQMPKPFPAARAMLVCPRCGKVTRIGYRVLGDKRVRVCKRCDATV